MPEPATHAMLYPFQDRQGLSTLLATVGTNIDPDGSAGSTAPILAALPSAPVTGVLITSQTELQSQPDGSTVSTRSADDLPWPSPPLDVVVVVGALRRLERLSLFNQAFDHLKAEGQLLILDRCCLQPSGVKDDPLPWLEHLLAQAGRAGFELTQQQHFSSAPERASCLYLLRWQRSGAPHWRLHVVHPHHAPTVRALFEPSFGQPMSQALWEWKYGGGRGHALWIEQDGEMIGHLGIMKHRVVWQGQTITVGQHGDAMVRADQRGGVHGPYFLVGSTISELFVGDGGTYLMGFAFAFEKQMRFFEYTKLGQRIDRMVQLTWPAIPQRWSTLWATRPLRLPQDHNTVNRLWADMQADLRDAVVGVRDGDRLCYRYLEHPSIAYQLHLVYHRWSRRPLGVAVLKLEPGQAVLVDWVGSLRHAAMVIHASRHLAHAAGKATLSTWITTSHRHVLASSDANIQDLDIFIHYTTWSPTPAVSAMQGRWWLTMGDTDYL